MVRITPVSSHIVTIPTRHITDWDSFHATFKGIMGFPDFYGNNMNAWIDCMSDLDEDTGMSKIQVKSGELLLLCIEDSTDFKNRAPDLYDAMVEAIGFVNMRRLDPTASYASKTPVLGLLPIDSLE